jgi:Xaa-Pro dipeptidase
MHQKRIDYLQELMVANKINILAINAGVDLQYLTGMSFHLSERPAVLLVPPEGESAFIFPEFESGKADQSQIELALFPYPEDNRIWLDVFARAAKHLNLSQKTISVAPETMRYLELDLIQKAAGHSRFDSAQEVIKTLKIQKDENEIAAIRKAISIAEKALIHLLPHIKPGTSEKSIANQLVINLLSEGCEPEIPFPPIIASGPNSASPHSVPTERIIQIGDSLIIDWGARHNGYISDITRTFFVGAENNEMREAASVVLEANKSARAIVREGIPANKVDAAARDVITHSGYGEAFTHRTGHGIGLVPHEDPYISSTNSLVLKTGMVFTIEPGIYLPGKGGIRIEDDVLVNKDTFETLTNLPREVAVI